MESDNPLDAPAALNAVARARADVADRLVTPWWYHPILGVLIAQHALVQGFDNRNWTLPSALVLVIGCVALVSTAAAAVVLVVNITLGRRYDELLRHDLRNGDEARG
jgi:hypothetical protein